MLFDRKLDALAADHNSLLSAAVRILETLEELRIRPLRVAPDRQTDATAFSLAEQPPPQFLEKLNFLPTELKELFERREAASLELFNAAKTLLGSLEDRFAPSLESMREELSYNSQLVAEHLPLHIEGSSFSALNPEAGLMNHLYSFLPVGTALDVGANRGDISLTLLDAGYQVYAFEPCPDVFEKLRSRLSDRQDCFLFDFAIGSADATMDLHIVKDSSAGQKYGDASLFSSLVPHSMPTDLEFVSAISVPVRSLASLASEGKIPREVGLLKVDTEGFDQQVLRGMGDLRPQIVAAEFWSPDFVFAQSEASNRLDQLVEEMRARGYRWYIVVYRLSGSNRVSFYCNYNRAVSNSWGNVFFFHDHALFLRALEWCSALLPRTYMNVEDTTRGLHLAHSEATEPSLKARLGKLEKLLAKQDELNELIAAQKREIAAYEDKVVRLNKQTKDAQERLRRAEARFDKMRRSLSWKLTSPVRELGRAAERLFRLFE
jgi:FkbM family methyltransferase